MRWEQTGRGEGLGWLQAGPTPLSLSSYLREVGESGFPWLKDVLCGMERHGSSICYAPFLSQALRKTAVNKTKGASLL